MIGIFGSITNINAVTWLQLKTDMHMQGRIASLVVFAAVALDEQELVAHADRTDAQDLPVAAGAGAPADDESPQPGVLSNLGAAPATHSLLPNTQHFGDQRIGRNLGCMHPRQFASTRFCP